MNENLDDLISAHREGVRLTGEQHARNKARLLSRVAAGVAVSTAAAGASTSTAIAATTTHAAATTMIVKVLIGLAVVGGAGAAYYASRPANLVAVAPTPIAAPAVAPVPAATEPNAVEPTVPAEPVADIAAPSPRAAKPSASSSSSLAGEIQLMHDVESALSSGQPGRALQLLDDAAKSGHGGRYGGTMGEERAAARVVTLCRLGRVDDARAEAARFVRDRPRSPLVERVRSTCAKGSESR